ncbi:MAG: DUF4157 domain-containing protein [Chloroflexi bacterium]|nr:DUF4157 domain-containing protein [Chloroflexota bacterium]
MVRYQKSGSNTKNLMLNKTPVFQRRCSCGKPIVANGKCSECNIKKKRAKNNKTEYSERPLMPLITNEVLTSTGKELDPNSKANMERYFDFDFSKVRIHTDSKAAKSAKLVGAGAYTVGNNIVFGNSLYQPEMVSGQKLLSHELAHVVQQSKAPQNPNGLRPIEEPSGSLEREAEQASYKIINNQKPQIQLQASYQAPQFGIIGCMWWMWWYSKYIKECQDEFSEACDDDLLSQECQEFMDGSGWPSHSIQKCVGRKNPKALAKLLSSCSTVSFGRIFRGPRASLEKPIGNPPSEFDPQNQEGNEGTLV